MTCLEKEGDDPIFISHCSSHPCWASSDGDVMWLSGTQTSMLPKMGSPVSCYWSGRRAGHLGRRSIRCKPPSDRGKRWTRRGEGVDVSFPQVRLLGLIRPVNGHPWGYTQYVQMKSRCSVITSTELGVDAVSTGSHVLRRRRSVMSSWSETNE